MHSFVFHDHKGKTVMSRVVFLRLLRQPLYSLRKNPALLSEDERAKRRRNATSRSAGGRLPPC